MLIEKHIAPKLSAAVTKLAEEGGKFTDFLELEDHHTQLKTADMMLRMHGAYAPKDPAEAAQFAVKVIVIDIPEPQIGVLIPGPGQLPITTTPINGSTGSSGNAQKPQE